MTTAAGAMTDQPELSPLQREPRTEPVQRRSLQRVDLLLDTAADIIDAQGVNGLTTSSVAAQSHSSVGVVYRYFPNIDSLLLALAARNMELYRERLAERIATDGLSDWTSLVRHAILSYADLARSEPGFRIIRFGDLIVFRFPEVQSDSNRQLATQFGSMFVERFGFTSTPEFLDELELAIEVADALTRRAFLHDRAGDDRVIERTIALEISILSPFAPTSAPTSAA